MAIFLMVGGGTSSKRIGTTPKMTTSDVDGLEDVPPDASSAEGFKSRRPFSAARAWGFHLIGVFLFAAFYVKVVSYFRQLFEEFELDLPALTEFVITFSNLMTYRWYLVFPVILAVDGLLAAVMAQLPERLAWVRSLWFWGFFWLIGLAVVWGLFTIALPWLDLVSSLSD